VDQPTKDDLLARVPPNFDTSKLQFDGLRGDPSRHLPPEALLAGLAALPPPPRDVGSVDLLVARGRDHSRKLPTRARLTAAGGMPGDRFALQTKSGPNYQLAATQTDHASLIANGQPLELHGDNLYLTLDLSTQNLTPGSRVRVGEAVLEVTPQAHNGCKKWVQRFGLPPMRLNMDPAHRDRRLRGIYFRVVEDGDVAVGARVEVISRAL